MAVFPEVFFIIKLSSSNCGLGLGGCGLGLGTLDGWGIEYV